MIEDEMIGRHHRLNGHEFEQVLGDGEGQGSLECCSPWGCKDSDTTEQLNWTELIGDVKQECVHEIFRQYEAMELIFKIEH